MKRHKQNCKGNQYNPFVCEPTYGKHKGKNEIVPVIIQTKDIGRLIYTIRGKQVMLDHDLAALG